MLGSKLKFSEFNRHVIIVMAGTLLSQALPILASPLLTRIYSAQQFGIFTLYFSTANIFALLATLRYEMAIMLPEKKNEALHVLLLSIILAIVITLITIPLIFLLRGYFAEWFNEPEVIHYFLFIPVSVLFTGLYMCGYYWLLRNKSFRKVSVARFLQNFIWVLCSVVFGLIGWKSGGLIYGLIIGQGFSALIVFSWLYLDISKEKIVFEKSLVKELSIRYKNFPGINSLHALVDAVQLNGITYLLSLFYGNHVLGFYAIAYRTLRTPLAMIGSAMSQVLYQRFSDANNKGELMKPMMVNSIRTLFLIGIIPFALLFFAGPWLFKIIFGNEWQSAGQYAQVLVPWLFFNFILSPLSQLPNVLQRQSKYFLLTLTANLSAFALLVVVALNNGTANYALFAYSICMTLFTSIMIRWKYNLVSSRDIKISS